MWCRRSTIIFALDDSVRIDGVVVEYFIFTIILEISQSVFAILKMYRTISAFVVDDMWNLFVIQFRLIFERKILFPESCELVEIHTMLDEEAFIYCEVSI
ncbi:hypothetical protein NY2A_B445L [Paramecium bursaria Chlorella virus NY2A]|uniref:Uncharacterized protein B445L n=1 Tax=Paramecium bursaria Chlorella virus NY2A TaxID=46021 RepID=A7IWX0_PBCVN|nr:hypothetical protein NY2A_B445L [Paramecium bursaria Chlorella virus NY2A]ABT14844.1 hypothetical protein NY2A_B445L [Paramecium bursaria Chlorella virus NY2A]